MTKSVEEYVAHINAKKMTVSEARACPLYLTDANFPPAVDIYQKEIDALLDRL